MTADITHLLLAAGILGLAITSVVTTRQLAWAHRRCLQLERPVHDLETRRGDGGGGRQDDHAGEDYQPQPLPPDAWA